ncbi:MAG: GNAT family N-acetyltransferase [Nocardioidaceae bacterium]
MAERDEQLVGYAVLGVAGESAEVRRIAVAAGSQRCGVGTSLLAELLASARQRGCSEVFLEVHPDNAAAAGLYARFEFAELYRRRRYYADGSDALVLRAPVTC